MQLVDLVLDDGIMRDLLDDVADAGQRGGFAGASRRSQAALPVLAAVSLRHIDSTADVMRFIHFAEFMSSSHP